MKSYNTFNVDQVDPLPERYYGKPIPDVDCAHGIEHADGVCFDRRKHSTRWQARFSGGSDHVQVPPFEYIRCARTLLNWTVLKAPGSHPRVLSHRTSRCSAVYERYRCCGQGHNNVVPAS